MKHEHFEIDYRLVQLEELSDADRQLVEKAKEATGTSFSPYSHFRVGAALRMENGEVYLGSNQENASFTTGLCAERTAIFYAPAKNPGAAVTDIAIAARGTDGEYTAEPTSPCGACRQVLAEIEHRAGRPMRLLLYSRTGIIVIESVGALLPLQFNGDNL